MIEDFVNDSSFVDSRIWYNNIIQNNNQILIEMVLDIDDEESWFLWLQYILYDGDIRIYKILLTTIVDFEVNVI